jgi:hypothetical protein
MLVGVSVRLVDGLQLMAGLGGLMGGGPDVIGGRQY